MIKQISDNAVYLLIKYTKSVLWRVAKRLSYIGDARCLKVNMRLEEGTNSYHPFRNDPQNAAMQNTFVCPWLPKIMPLSGLITKYCGRLSLPYRYERQIQGKIDILISYDYDR